MDSRVLIRKICIVGKTNKLSVNGKQGYENVVRGKATFARRQSDVSEKNDTVNRQLSRLMTSLWPD